MRHAWIMRDDYAQCGNCGTVVDHGSFEAGLYDVACSPLEHTHHIISAPFGSECYYCGKRWT